MSAACRIMGIARGYTPQGGEKIRRNLHGKFVSEPPGRERESITFRTFSVVQGRFGGGSGSFSSF